MACNTSPFSATAGGGAYPTVAPDSNFVSKRWLFVSDNTETVPQASIGPGPAKVLYGGSLPFGSNGTVSVRVYMYHAKSESYYGQTCQLQLYASLSGGNATVSSLRHYCEVRNGTSPDGTHWTVDDYYSASGAMVAYKHLYGQLTLFADSAYDPALSTSTNNLVSYTLSGTTHSTQYFIVSVIQFEVTLTSGSGELQLWTAMLGPSGTQPSFQDSGFVNDSQNHPRGLWPSCGIMSLCGGNIVGPPKVNDSFSFAVDLGTSESACFEPTVAQASLGMIGNNGAYGADINLFVDMQSAQRLPVWDNLGISTNNNYGFCCATVGGIQQVWTWFPANTSNTFGDFFYSSPAGYTYPFTYAVGGGGALPGEVQFFTLAKDTVVGTGGLPQ